MMLYRNSILAAVLVAGFSPSPARAANLPEGLQARLEESLLSCSYQLFATKGASRLESEPNFMNIVRQRFEQDLSLTQAGSSGTAFSSAAALGLGMVFNRPWNNNIRYASAAASTSGASSYSLGMWAEKKNGSEIKFNRNELSAYAGRAARGIGRIMALDPIRENALRSEIIRRALKQVENKDRSDLDLFSILKEATYSGKPLLTAAERNNLDEIFKRSENPIKTEESSAEDKVKFLAACKEVVKLQLPNLSGREKDAAEKVANDTERFQKDLDAYIGLHPEAKGLATPKPSRRSAGGSSDTDANTSMSVE